MPVTYAERSAGHITGLNLEGCRWNGQAGILEESLPREMFARTAGREGRGSERSWSTV